MKTKKTKKIDKVVIRIMPDENPDTSRIGEYTDNFRNGVIVRRAGEFFEKLPEDYEFPGKGREFRCFKPCAGGEEVGTKEYYEYGMQDYKRMEALNRGDWSFVSIAAEATILTPVNCTPAAHLINRIHSGGLWGIESDSDKEYLEEVKRDELAGLRQALSILGFSKRQIDKAFKNVEEDEK
jgi:hypothetical protein